MRILTLWLVIAANAAITTRSEAQAASDFVEAYRDSATLEVVAFHRDGRLAAFAYLDTVDRIVEAQYFDRGVLTRRVRNTYTAVGDLKREVHTLYGEHEFDIVKEYAYQNRQLVHHLHGNNHTGRWSSEGYVYNERGDLTAVEHYRKNGDLAYRTAYALTYDASGRLTRKHATKTIIPTDSTHADWENEVAIGDALVPTPEAADRAATTTVYAYDKRDRLKRTAVYDYRGRPTVETDFSYGGGGRTELSSYYAAEGGVGFRESATYDALGRMNAQTIAGATRRYRYAGDSNFLIAVD